MSEALERLKKALIDVQSDLTVLQEQIEHQEARDRAERDLAYDQQIVGVRFHGNPKVYTYRFHDKRWNTILRQHDYVTVLSPASDTWEIVKVARVRNVQAGRYALKECYPLQWKGAHQERGEQAYQADRFNF